MATSGSKSVTVTSWDTLKFSWSRSSYSITNNTSTISWTLQLISTSSGKISSTASKTWKVTVNGTSYSGTNTVGIAANTTKTLASGTTTIAHNNDGTKTFSYSFSQQFDINFNGSIGTKSGSGSGTLDSIPRQATLTSAPNFTDADSPTIYFSNPAGSAVTVKVCISWTGGDDIPYRTVTSGATSYKFTFTDAEKTKLYSATANSAEGKRYVTFYVTTVIGSSTYYSTKQVLFTVTNCTPTLSPTVVDHGGTSTSLTGDSSRFIKGFNSAYCTFNASAKKGATITSTKVTCGNLTRWSDGYLNNVTSGTFVFTVTDSRGFTASTTLTKTLVDYTPLTFYSSYSPNLAEDNTVDIVLSMSGDFIASEFGTVTNTLYLGYRYKINGGDYTTDDDGNEVWTSITPTINSTNKKYTATATVSDISYQDTCTIQLKAYDATGSKTATHVVKVKPIFDWGENDFNINGGLTYEIQVKGSGFDVDNMLTSGKYYMGNDAINKPGTSLNGWLEVQARGGGNCYQKYNMYTGERFERIRNDSVWGEWQRTDRPILVLKLSGTDISISHASSYGHTIIPFNATYYSSPGLSLAKSLYYYDNGIKIGSNVKTVLLQANFRLSIDGCYGLIRANNHYDSYYGFGNTNMAGHVCTINKVLNVTSEEHIQICFGKNSAASGTLYDGQFSVEVIA